MIFVWQKLSLCFDVCHVTCAWNQSLKIIIWLMSWFQSLFCWLCLVLRLTLLCTVHVCVCVAVFFSPWARPSAPYSEGWQLGCSPWPGPSHHPACPPKLAKLRTEKEMDIEEDGLVMRVNVYKKQFNVQRKWGHTQHWVTTRFKDNKDCPQVECF